MMEDSNDNGTIAIGNSGGSTMDTETAARL